MCAYELERRGFEVVVFEAQNHPGGRVLTLNEPYLGGPIESGGEFIGANHPLWQTLARRFGLELYEIPESEGSAPLMVQGRVLDATEARQAWEGVDTLTAKLTDLARTVDAERPFASTHAEKVDARSLEDWLRESPSSLGISILRGLMVHDNGVSADHQSLLGLLAMIKGHGLEAFWTDTESHRCRGGNQQLASALAKALQSDLRFETPVAGLSTRADGTRVRVVLYSGSVVEVDRVVLAVPPSVWERIRFEDPALQEALHKAPLQMGTAVKALALFDSPRWQDSGRAPNATSDGIIGYTWNPLAGAPDITSSNLVPMTCFAGGPTSFELTTHAQNGSLGTLLEPLYPGTANQVQQVRTFDWSVAPWTSGGYSFPAPGELSRIGRTIYEGIGPISFAGEHCSPAFVGYMEGALQSGVRVARQISGESTVIDTAQSTAKYGVP